MMAFFGQANDPIPVGVELFPLDFICFLFGGPVAGLFAVICFASALAGHRYAATANLSGWATLVSGGLLGVVAVVANSPFLCIELLAVVPPSPAVLLVVIRSGNVLREQAEVTENNPAANARE